MLLVGQQASVDGVRQPPFQPAQRFLGRLALGQLSPVVDLAGAGHSDLDHGHHVEGVIELAVPARDRRWRMTWPLEASSGAVPVWAWPTR
jgi:hypothetical protein